MTLIARHNDLKALSRWHTGRSNRAGLLILYGRPRTGKHALVREWLRRLRRPPALYWVPPLGNAFQQHRDLCDALNAVASAHGLPSKSWTFSDRYVDWAQPFQFMDELASKAGDTTLFIFDHFERCGDQDVRTGAHAIWGFKSTWDLQLQHNPNVRIVLMSSHTDWVVNNILSYSAPLYGRATAHFDLRPMRYDQLQPFLPYWTPEDRIAAYALTGGVAGYLTQLVPCRTFRHALREVILVDGSDFVMDADNLLQTYAPDTALAATLVSTLARAAGGTLGWEATRGVLKLGPKAFRHLLLRMGWLGWVKAEYPLLGAPLEKYAKLVFADSFLHFYLSIIAPNLARVRQGRTQAAVADVLERTPEFIQLHTFKHVCREWLGLATATGQLDLWPDSFGTFDMQAGSAPPSHAVDAHSAPEMAQALNVSAVDKSHAKAFLGAAYWRQTKTAAQVERLLQDFTGASQAALEQAPVISGAWQGQYGVFVAGPVSDRIKARAARAGVRLVDLTQLEHDLLAHPRA